MAAPAELWIEGCRTGELRYQWDPVRGRPFFYPRVIAPGSAATPEWRVSSGRGTVYSATVVRQREAPPSCIALIDLDEGFRMLSRVEGMEPTDVTIGMRVRVRFSGDDPPLPVFVPGDAP